MKTNQEIEKEFDNRFGYRDIYEIQNDDPWQSASMVRSTGCNDCEKCKILREEHKQFILKIRQEDKEELIKRIKEESFWGDEYDDKIITEDKVIEIIKN